MVLWQIIALGIITLLMYVIPFKENIPQEMINEAKELDKQSENKEELIINVYNFVNQSYKSTIRQYLKEPNKIFMKDINKIWQQRGEYMPSNAQNEVAKQMLIATGKFNAKDFKEKQLWCEVSPHSALFVTINNKNYVLDLWFADHNGEFNCYTQNPCGTKKICLN